MDFFLIFGREISREIWRDFCGIFLSTHKIKDQIFRGKYRSIFREKIHGSKKTFRANFVLQTCRPKKFGGSKKKTKKNLGSAKSQPLSDPTEIPPYRDTGVAIPLSHRVFCVVADYRCYTPASFRKNGRSQSKDRPNKGGGGIAEKACLLSLSNYRGRRTK